VNYKSRYIVKLVCFVLIFMHTTSTSQDNSKILFIYMCLHENVLVMEKVKVVNGKLKPKRSQNISGLYYEITGQNGKPINSDFITKPKEIPYDYIGTDGRLKGGTGQVSEEMFVLKIPFNHEMKDILFYATKILDGQHLNKTREAGSIKDTLIARFPLNFEEK
jgi:hypothetical protein